MLDGSSHGIYRALPPILNDGDVSVLQLDLNGNLKVAIMAVITTISQGLNIAPRIVTGSGPVTLTSSDYVVEINKTLGSSTSISTPSNTIGEAFLVVDGKGDASSNNITITPSAGTINGAATYVITTNYGSVSFFCDGTNWLITSKT